MASVRPDFIPFTAPNLCKEYGVSYDNLDFAGFASRQGWRLKSLYPCEPACLALPATFCIEHNTLRIITCTREDGGHVSNTEVACFLQAWAFFGILFEVSAACESPLDIENDFLVDDGNSVSTAGLNGLASTWFDALGRLDHRGLRKRLERINAALRHLMLLRLGFLHDPELYEINGNAGEPREYRVMLSIDILGRVMGLLLSYHPPEITNDLLYPPPTGRNQDKRFLFEPHFKWRVPVEEVEGPTLEKKGWCRSQIRRLRELESSYLVFANHLERPLIVKANHSQCDDLICKADHISDEIHYKTAHYLNCDGTCGDPVSVDGKQLADILGRGGIPRIHISSDLQLTVVDEGPYICISHVWAHGLGNPHGNSLPRCQLRRLQKQISEAFQQQSVSLWMDTLCIPVHDDLKKYRKKAIGLLGRTFVEAALILVLDRELERIQSSRVSILELTIRILCGGWMQRLWTFQEAACAIEDPSDLNRRRLFFQMADGALSHETLTSFTNHRAIGNDRFQLQENEVIAAHLYGPALVELRRRISSLETLRNSPSRFSIICSAVASRTTSKMEDEPLILAIIMELDISTIMGQPTIPQKWQVLYIMMGKLSPDVLFDQHIKKLLHSPFRWAPASLLVNAVSLSSEPSQWGICTPNGLNLIYPGLVFESDGIITGSGFLRDEKTGRSHKVFGILDSISGKNILRPVPGKTAIIYGNWMGAVIVNIDREDMVEEWDAPVLTVSSKLSHWETETDGADGPWRILYATVVGYTDMAPIVYERDPLPSDILVTELSQWQRWVIT